MKRITKWVLVFALVFCFSLNVKAEEVFYTNPNGVELTEEEYNFLTTFYWDDYVTIMTEEQYEDFQELDWQNGRLITASTTDNETMCSIQSPTHQTPYKTLGISALCTTECTVSLVNTWDVDPGVRSWDVIGAYLSNVSLTQHVTTYVYSSAGSTSYNNLKTAYNGIGNSVKLPNSGSGVVVNMIFKTTTGGHIFGSYQHATEYITLLVSKNYNFSLGGYGSVFSFYGNAIGKYDGMAGVDIAV